ncbi:MAG: 50S ribosomal protein L44e [Nanoarchaeota archaeon]
MKIPKTIKRFCRYCRKHTEQKVAHNKKRAPSSLSRGSKYRAKLRGAARGTGNLGRYSKPAVTKFKRTGAKNTKKTDLRFTCNVCKKTSCQSKGIRTKKMELV